MKCSETETTATALLAGLKSWGDIAHDDASAFVDRFCPDAWMLASVSWDCENMRVVYILDSGQHIADSFKIAEWIDFLKANDKDERRA